MTILADDQDERETPGLAPNPVVLIAGSAAIAALSFAALPLVPAIASTLLGALMVAGADIDSRTFLLPDTVSFGAMASGLVAAFVLAPDQPWLDVAIALARGIGSAAVLAALAFGYWRWRAQEGLGLGDIKLAAAIGIWLPLHLIPACFALAAVAGLVAAGLAHLRGRAMTGATPIPFGAFLCPALWLVFYASALPN